MGRNRVRTLCAFVVILLLGALAFNSLDLVALQGSEQKDAVVEEKPVPDKTDSFSPKVLKPYWVDRNNNDIADSLDEEIANRSAHGAAKEYADVIVMLRSKPNVEDANIFALLGGYLTTSPWAYALYGFGGQISYDQISRFALSDANVLLVEKDQPFYGTVAYAARQIGARTYVWNTMGLQGDSQSSIAIFDSGIDDSHPDFSPGYRDQDFSEKIVGWNDLVNYLSSPYDDAGHGSHVAGLAAGDGFFSTDASGNTIATWGEYMGSTNYSSSKMFRSGMMVNKTGLIEVSVKWKNTGPGNGYFNSLKLYNGNKNLASSQWTKLVTLNIPNQETWYNMTYNVASTPSGGYDMYHLAFNMTGSNNGQKDNFYYVMTLSWPYSPPADGFQASTGVAPQTKLVCAKVLDYKMMGSSSRLISAINWIVPNRVAYHIVVASMSLASSSDSSSVDNAVTNLVNSGVTTVVGAGNQFTSHQGLNWIFTPGSVDEVITVAAIDQFDHIADYSSEGGPSTESGGQTVKPDIAAPGGSWNAAVPMFSADSNDQDAYNYWPDTVANDSMAWRGTSMATPMVSGSASIIVQAMGGFSNWQYTRTQALQVKNILLMTATETYPNPREVYPLYSPTLERGDKDVHEGYGRLNLDAAVDAVLKAYTIGTTVTDTLGKPPTTTDISVLGQKLAWARKVQLNTLGLYNFTLTVPTDADFDMYLYNSTGTYYGEPFIVAKSTNATTGGEEQIIVTPPYNGTYYLVVKRATEATGGGTFTLRSSSNQPQYTLTVNSSPAGSGSVSYNSTGPYYYGDKVQLTAIPAVGWTFSSWSGDLAGSVSPSVITINGNKTVTASFAQLQYTLTWTVSPVGSGSVNLNSTDPYHYGDRVELTAVPTVGWNFSSWSGDLVGSVNPSVITMDGNKTITAAFTQLQYTLWVTISPSEGGSVSLNNTGPYYYGDGVRLTAIPDVGWNFSSWSGDLTGSINPAVITIDGNKTVTATFAQLQYSLTVTVSPLDSGSVSLNNTGPYYYGDIIELTAVPTTCWKFSNWSGDLSGSANPAVITINGNKTVTAHFSELEYSLTVTVSPVGSGSVSYNNTGPYHYGDEVQLTASPTVGWTFFSWSGDLTGSANPEVIIMTGNKSVTAIFAQLEYALTVTVSPTEGGSVSRNNSGPYHYGDWVKLTAVAHTGWLFNQWSGDASGTDSQVDILIDGDKSVNASFTQIEYTLNVTVSPAEGGTVSRNASEPYHYGDQVQLTATPIIGWTFSSWGGDLTGSVNPTVITMNGSKTVTATFTQLQYTLTVAVSPVGSGSVSLNKTDLYNYGDWVELTALSNAGWQFSTWSEDLVGNSNPTSIFIDGNRTVTANFILLEYFLTLTVSPEGSGLISLNATGPYRYGDIIELTASPAAGWAFSFWSGDSAGSNNPDVITMTSNKSVTARFIQLEFTLTLSISPVEGGYISKNASEPYHYGDIVQLIASPYLGWRFSGWTGDIVSTDNPIVITMDGNKTVTASFTQLEFTLTVTVSPEGSGSVSLNASGPHHYGDVVSLTAVPTVGWAFFDWTGDLSGSINPAVITIDSNKSVAATFSQLEYALIITVSPVETGYVSRNSSGPYYHGDNVELTASPNLGWTFSAWTGDVVSPDNPLVIAMNGNMTVTAHFTQLEYTLIVTVSPVASGYVSLNATGPYHYGDVIELTATPSVGYSFSYWSGDLSGYTSSTSIFMDGNKTVVANFIQLEYTLTVTANPIEGGFVNRNYTGPYHYGDSVQLTAVPTTGWAFFHWSGDLTGSVNPAVVIMDGNKTVTATFTYHDVAVTEVVPSSTLVYAGNKLSVTVTLKNKGLNTESFNVTLFCNTTSIEMQTVSNLAPNSTTTLNFAWSTSGYAYGYYTISANATPVPGEANTFDNTRTYDGVVLTILGDINGDTRVDASDLFTLNEAYGSTPGASNWNLNCDINQDNRVDIADLFVLSKNYEDTVENAQNISRQETSLDAILLPFAALPVFAIISSGRNHLKTERKTVRNRSKKRAENIQPKLAHKTL